MTPARWLVSGILFLSVAAGGLPACHHDADTDGSSDPSTPRDDSLPPLTLKDDTPNLLLTWIDDTGDFRVVTQPAEVPEKGRKAVRVVVTTDTHGTGQVVYVADLTRKKADGGYPVTTMPRSVWDEKGASLRKARMEALAPSARPPAPAGSGSSEPGAAPVPGGVVAIVYGAEWCGACHDAERYLKQRGIQVIHKDIEKSALANREMQEKLSVHHLSGGSIPVLDIGGRVLVGFSPSAIDAALTAARATETL